MCVWERVEERGCVVQISFISLQKNFRLRGGGGWQGRGCFARKPSFTLTLSDSILSNLIPKKKLEIITQSLAFHVLEKAFSLIFQ